MREKRGDITGQQLITRGEVRDTGERRKTNGNQHKEMITRGDAGPLMRDVNKQRHSSQHGFNTWLKPEHKTRQFNRGDAEHNVGKVTWPLIRENGRRVLIKTDRTNEHQDQRMCQETDFDIWREQWKL